MYKKLLKKFVLFLLAANFLIIGNTVAFAHASKKPSFGWFKKEVDLRENFVPYQLENNIKESIEKIYGKEQVDIIYSQVLKIIKHAKQDRPLKFYIDDLERESDWYKDEIIYMLYVDQFGVKDKSTASTFKDTVEMLDYLKDLGVTTIFMLPFIDSPMGDAGFDIRDPKNVRDSLGGVKEFMSFISEAKNRGFKIKADFILNHFSDQHEWFQQVIQGDTEKINYFVHRSELPDYERYQDEKSGTIIKYKEKDGVFSKRKLIFSDICENHYRKVNINGKDHYFYHTFYPFQIDVNWENPEVLYYMLDTLAYWANIGVDIFRMDAIPYCIKKKGTNAENLAESHAVIKLISSFLQSIAPRSVIQADARFYPKDILPYLGEESIMGHKILFNKNKEIKRTNKVQIAYHFPFVPSIWASLLTHDKTYFWNAYEQTPVIPETTTWAMFLRTHDELTLEMIDVETRELIYNSIVDKGAEFKNGFGISGRMANFLENKPDRISLAFSVLLSMPGIPIIYYGDEVGAQNNWRYAKTSEAQRETMTKDKDEEFVVKSFFDSRDINRGPITKKTFYEAKNSDESFNGKIYKRVKKLISLRKSNSVISRGEFQRVDTSNNQVLSYLRKSDEGKILIINNLSAEKVITNIKLDQLTTKKIKKQKVLKELISGNDMQATSVSQDTYKFDLAPYQCMWVKLD